jgi:tyrosine-protein kinase Etk/Wzc
MPSGTPSETISDTQAHVPKTPGAAMRPGQDSEEDFHLLDLLIVLAKHRRLIIGLTVGFAVLATIIVLTIPSQYTAEAVLLPPGQNSSAGTAFLMQAVTGSSALASAAGASLGLKNPSDLYVALLHSRTVEDAMVKRFGLMDRYHRKTISDARKALEKHTAVSASTKDGLITVTATDRDPRQAADMANAYVDELHNLSAHLAITEAAQRRAFFQQQLLEANENLASAEEALKSTEQSTGVLQIDAQTRTLVESAAALRAQITAKEVQLQGMRAYATDDNPQMVEAKQQLAALQGQLGQLTGAGTSAGADTGLIVPKGKVPEAGLEYLRKLRDVKYYETISELLARQFEMAKVDEARQGTAVQVVDTAVPPDHRSFPKRTITIIVAAFLGLILACIWSIVFEGWLRQRTNPADAERLAALRAAMR